MINLSLTFPRMQFIEFGRAMQMLFTCANNLDADEYFHYYNVRSISKKVIDKQYKLVHSHAKKVTMPININEFESVKYVYNSFEDQLQDAALSYNRVLIEEMINTLDQQQKSIVPYTLLSQQKNIN